MVKITVTYDMGWQKRSYGRRYDYYSRHVFIIGGIYKSIIGIVLNSKASQRCDYSDKRGEESEKHECPKNFEGRSKIMEAAAIMKMVYNAFCNFCFIIYDIVSDYVSTM